MTLKPRFKKPSKKPDIDSLIDFIKSTTDVAAIDEVLRKASRNPPFYPDDRKLTDFFISTKSDPLLDIKVRAAAALSAPLREKALIDSRESNKEGAFTNFVYVDTENPLESKVYKVIRAPQIGSGTGAWGGLKEDDDIDVSVTVNREIYEEVIDAVKLLLKIEGSKNAQTLEAAFDASLKSAFDKKQPPSEGVFSFIGTLPDGLREKAAGFAAMANDLIEGLVAADKQRLFKAQDDSHAISRGWGFKVDAYGHVAALPKAMAEKFDAFHTAVEGLKTEAVKKGLSAVAGEMQGIEIYTLAQAPHKVEKNHYGHEGFGEIAGFARLLKQADASFDTQALWGNFRDSGSVGTLAKKMRLSMDSLERNYRQIVNASADTGYTVFTTAEYAAAHRDKTRDSAKPPKI